MRAGVDRLLVNLTAVVGVIGEPQGLASLVVRGRATSPHPCVPAKRLRHKPTNMPGLRYGARAGVRRHGGSPLPSVKGKRLGARTPFPDSRRGSSVTGTLRPRALIP